MITHLGAVSDFWSQKRALSREILGEDTLLREACPDLCHDRSRFDLMLWRGKLGVRGPKKRAGAWDFDFHEEYPVEYLNERLVTFIEDFKHDLKLLDGHFEAAQLRFRYDGKDSYGVWIDTKRDELERFAQSAECKRISERCVLELGQRGDILERKAHCWLPSYTKDNDEIPLKSYISSFSQPGPEANRALIACGMELLEDFEAETWVELGAGYGNLTAAFTTLLGSPRWILEKERTSALLEMNKAFFPNAEFFHQSAESFSKEEVVELLVADPPRSGFSEFFKNDFLRAKNILLYSCDLKGLLRDAEALRTHYSLKKWSLIDCFPGTPYAEVVSFWERIE